MFVIGAARRWPAPRGLAIKGSFGRIEEHPACGLDWPAGLPGARPGAAPDPGRAHRRPTARVARGSRSADTLGRAATPQSLEVIAREWRVGEGPAGAMPPDAGTAAQRALFAGVRENQYAVGADGAPRPAAELLARSRGSRRPSSTAWRSRSRWAARSRPPRSTRRSSRTASPRASARPPCWARSATSRRSCCRPGAAPCWPASRRATSPIWSTPTAERCPPSARGHPRLRRHDLRRDGEGGRGAPPLDKPSEALRELTALAAEVAAGKLLAAAAAALAASRHAIGTGRRRHAFWW